MVIPLKGGLAMFNDRKEAGTRLAVRLAQENLENPIIVAIPRGGVAIASVVSRILQIPMSALVVKKIGAPNNPELAIGAVGSTGEAYFDEDIVSSLGIDDLTRQKLLQETKEFVLLREENLGISLPEVAGKTSIVVDDGVATGATVVAAGIILKELGSSKVILATPLISKRTKHEISKYFSKIISVLTPQDFSAVGQFYREFPQVEDSEVKKILKNSDSD